MSIRQVSFEDGIDVDDISSRRISKYEAKKKKKRLLQDNILQQPKVVTKKPFRENRITAAVAVVEPQQKEETMDKETTVEAPIEEVPYKKNVDAARSVSEDLFRKLVADSSLWFCDKEVFFIEMKKDLHFDGADILIDAFYESRPGFLENLRQAYEIVNIDDWIAYRLKGDASPEEYMRALGLTTNEELVSKFSEDKELMSNAYARYLLEQQVAAIKQKKKVVPESTTKKDSTMSNPKKVKKMTSQVKTIEAKEVTTPTTKKSEIQPKKEKKMSKKAAPAVELSDEENTLVDTIVSRVQKNQRQETERVRSMVSSNEYSVYDVATTSIIAGIGIYAGFKVGEYVGKKISGYLAEKAVDAVIG